MDNELADDINLFWGLVFEIVTDMEKRLFAFLAEHDLTPPQFYVLKTLIEHGGCCRIGQIATEHHLTNATMTGLVNRLENMQPPLVTRQKSLEDGRSVDVLLTEEGSARFAAVQHALLNQASAVLRLLPPQERRDAMDKVRFYFKLLVEQFPVRGQ